ncbi:hypothetical protein DFH08DRAFT_818523 [Mycena albidolilacea]|uniref:Uncharacterized protein n=1 Tax=Mycena albidolilacea TaxID=1033008 RepID=A0AAD6ZH86_9AGAR|nr:hypothetical protein DFH08DRAFT_818523 [Mycena albidolilacea]
MLGEKNITSSLNGWQNLPNSPTCVNSMQRSHLQSLKNHGNFVRHNERAGGASTHMAAKILFGLHGVVVPKGELAIKVTTWSLNEGPGMFMLSEYPVINPQLSIETVWALLLFVQKGHYINLATDQTIQEAFCMDDQTGDH